MAEPAIETQQLVREFKKGPRAVDGIDLRVEPGEVYGFLGPNGAGKSTMIRTLLGFLHPTRGSATVLGLDVVADSVEIRRRTGYLPGGIALYDALSGADALEYLAALQDRGSAMREELCERLQMPASVLRRRVRDYSRGMRQKIGVIQAFQHDPELAILDEPTEGLDPLMQHAFYALMDDQRAKGRTIFFSSHVLSEVERVCDRVAIIRSGHLMALQNVEELLARRKKKVELRWRGAAPDLAGIPGLADVEVNGDRMRATLLGDVSGFVRAIASPSLEDLTIEPARLEEAFLEYYAGDDASEEQRG